MTFDFALEYIPRRMKELGYRDDYHLRLKYLLLGPIEVRTLEAYGQLIILVDTGWNARVESDMGVMDWNDGNLREYQFEHQGHITFTNKWEGLNGIQYIQVIPKRQSICL
ncbi:MAG TPA: hypothetical protein VF487_13525 [Chitinophagaceae bacterium]